MLCPKCRVENIDSARFCNQCGSRIALVCPQCGHECPEASKFCNECGHNLSEISGRTISSKETNSPGTVISEKKQPIADSDACAPIMSERKYMTVLFSDLSGYTELSEKLDPEDVKSITGEIFSHLTKIVKKYDGFVEKYVGDAILAVFGAVEAFEDSAIRAIRAAREIHNHIESINPYYEKQIGCPLTMHTGIKTGLVVTGKIDFDKGTHGMVGDTINTASRLMGISKSGQILVDRDSYSQAAGCFEFESIEPVTVKGKKKPLQAYRVVRILAEPQKVHRLHGLRANLIGRSIETQILDEAVEKVKKGKGSIISVCGTAGTGKSRLVAEFKATQDLINIQWFDGNAFPYTQNTPYYPLIDLLTKAFNIKEGDNKEIIKKKMELSLKELLGKETASIPFIGGLFSIDYSETKEVSPEYWKGQLFKSVHEIVKALAQMGPTVICLEDIHWADPSFMELIKKLLTDFTGRILFISIYRPVITLFNNIETQALKLPYSEIRLKELSPSETQNMVSSLLKSESIPQDLSRFIHDNVEGNPFYIEELINSLIESDTLSKKSGEWVIAKPISKSDIPSNIHGVIAGRIDRLGYTTKRIIQEASVIGRAFLYDILQRISEIDDNIEKNLLLLERLDLISTKSLKPTLEYIFKHALTQEIIYSGLVKKERQAIHEKIANVMEILFKDRLDEFYESMAYHYSRGTSYLKAIDFLIKSGEKSLRRFSLDESHNYFNEAFELLRNRETRSNQENEILVDLLNRWGMVYYYEGRFNKLEDILLSQEYIAEKINDSEIAGMFYAWCGHTTWWTGKYQKSNGYFQKALRRCGNQDLSKSKGYALNWYSWLCGDIGCFQDGIEYGEEAYQIGEEIGSDHYLYFKSLAGIGWNHYFMGNAEACLKTGKSLIKYGNKYSHIRCLVLGYWRLGDGYFSSGDFNEAIKAYQKAYDVAVDPLYLKSSALYLVVAYIAKGQISAAKKFVEDIKIYYSTNGNFMSGDIVDLLQGITYIDEGLFSKGMKLIKVSIRRCYEKERNGFIPTAEYIVGKLFLTILQGEKSVSPLTLLKNIGFVLKNAIFAAKLAEEHFLKAIETAQNVGATGIIGQAYFCLGLLHQTKKNSLKAQGYLKKSIEIFEKTGAYQYLSQANEALQSIENKYNKSKAACA